MHRASPSGEGGLRPRKAGRFVTEAHVPAPLRLLVVDDHEVVRQGLVSMLDRQDGFEVVAQAGTVADALGAARRYAPDMVLMDIGLPDGSGIEACREIRAELPAVKVLMLTGTANEEAVFGAILAGASGYVLKQVRRRALVAAVAAVGRGESLLDPGVTAMVLERVRQIAAGTYREGLEELTKQERKILLLVADGLTNREIAALIFLSDKTVKNYVSSILGKLSLHRRTEAAAFMVRHRLPGTR